MAGGGDFANTPPDQPNAYGPGMSMHDDPEYKNYRAELDSRRDLRNRAQYEGHIVTHYKNQLSEPHLTPEGTAKLQGRLEKAQRGHEAARAVAKRFGVDPDGPFPRDEWMFHGGKPPGG